MKSETDDLDRFYELIERLRVGLGGLRKLADINRRQDWPMRGVYFFFEPGEMRHRRSNVPRVVRVGTHALQFGATSTLYGRLRQHHGTRAGSGNHRGSVFRKHVGFALLTRDPSELLCASWGQGANAPAEVRLREIQVEQAVSRYLCNTSVLWLNIPDEPSSTSDRAFIEKNAIGLLAGKEPASPNWLGLHSKSRDIIRSYLWNVNHVDHPPDQRFLEVFESYVSRTVRSVKLQHD